MTFVCMITKHHCVVSFDYFFEVMSYPYVVTPVYALFLTRSALRYRLGMVYTSFLFLIVFDPQSHSCQRQDQDVHSSLLSKSNIDPTTCSSLCWSFQSHSFSKLTFLVCPQMMSCLDRIHQTYIVQIRVFLKQRLSQVLRSLQVLQISSNVVTRSEIFTFLGVPLIFKDYDLVNFEYRSYPCDLTNEISPKSTCLGYL